MNNAAIRKLESNKNDTRDTCADAVKNNFSSLKEGSDSLERLDATKTRRQMRTTH